MFTFATLGTMPLLDWFCEFSFVHLCHPCQVECHESNCVLLLSSFVTLSTSWVHAEKSSIAHMTLLPILICIRMLVE